VGAWAGKALAASRPTQLIDLSRIDDPSDSRKLGKKFAKDDRKGSSKQSKIDLFFA
jgi:hypothetical protein